VSTGDDRFNRWFEAFGQHLDRLFLGLDRQAFETEKLRGLMHDQYSKVTQIMLDGAREMEELRHLLADLSQSVAVTATNVQQVTLKIDALVDVVTKHEARLRKLEDGTP
jgi:hypothetical protein